MRILVAVVLALVVNACAATEESETESAGEAVSSTVLAAADAEIAKLRGAVVVFNRDTATGDYRGNNCWLRTVDSDRSSRPSASQDEIVEGTAYVVRRAGVTGPRIPRAEAYLEKVDDDRVYKGFLSPAHIYISWVDAAPTAAGFKTNVVKVTPVTWR
jgi:hypothetical protein